MNFSELKELAKEGKITLIRNPRYETTRSIWNKDYTEVREIRFMKYFYSARTSKEIGYRINKKDYEILSKIIGTTKKK